MSITPGNSTGAGSGTGIPSQFIPTAAVVPPGGGGNVPMGPDAGEVNPTPNTAPQNSTLVYSPDCRIIVAHNGQQFDISADIVRGTVIRKENAASTLMWDCHNK